jgi:hypothetical protein
LASPASSSRRGGRLKAYSMGHRIVRFDLNEVDAAMGREVGGAA